MPALRRPRLIALLAAGGIALVLTTWEDVPRAQTPLPPAVTSELPSWRAPGGRLVVRGTASPGAAVELLAGARRIARATARPGGAFVLRGRVPREPGRYRIVVQPEGDPGARADLGRLRVRAVRLYAAGDVNLGDRIATAMRVYGVRHPWHSVAPVLRHADLAFVNLECAISRRGAPVPKEFTFRGSPAALRAVRRYAGIDAVSLANNHSLDYGRTAFADTLRHARRLGLVAVGGGRNLAAARRARVFRPGGLQIALLAYSDVRPLGFDATPTRSGAAPAFPSLVAADVRRARARADLVVVYFHWGIERTFAPNARQRSLAAVALRAGAKVVLGAHPHVLQPIEGRRRGRLVAWSLGNFVFGANTPGTERTGILRLRLGAGGVRGWTFRRARIGGPFGVQPRLVG